jgi:hypothetical protein
MPISGIFTCTNKGVKAEKGQAEPPAGLDRMLRLLPVPDQQK